MQYHSECFSLFRHTLPNQVTKWLIFECAYGIGDDDVRWYEKELHTRASTERKKNCVVATNLIKCLMLVWLLFGWFEMEQKARPDDEHSREYTIRPPTE